jgi:hypothetical protein
MYIYFLFNSLMPTPWWTDDNFCRFLTVLEYSPRCTLLRKKSVPIEQSHFEVTKKRLYTIARNTFDKSTN